MMKKNLLGAIVIFFITLAFLLMIDDIASNENIQQQDTAENQKLEQQPNVVAIDEVE